MEIKETYYFSPRDFDINGKRVSDGTPFREILKEFEYDFHSRHSNHYALYLFANGNTMLLLSHSCNARKDMIYGMDLIDDDFDPDTNHIMEEVGIPKYITVYGIDSAFMTLDKDGIPEIDEEKKIYPLTLLVDSKLKDGVLQLKYLDDDDDEEDLVTEPVDVEVILNA